jgi:hypothetical protein
MKTIFLLVLSFSMIGAMSQELKEVPVKTNVNEVTVFINGAQVTRKKAIDVSMGKSVLKFTELSPYADPKSIRVKAGEDVIVLSVNHQFNYTDSMTKTKELEILNDKIRDIDDKINIQNAGLAALNEELKFLQQNMNIGGRNQDVSLNNLKSIFDYFAEKINVLKQNEIAFNKAITKLGEERNATEKQILQISGIQKTPFSEVLVKIDSKTQSRVEFELTYFVNNAGWFPSYDIRAESIDKPIELIYKASVHQNTKEDWKNIKLKLSSSTPNKSGIAPQLKTYYLDYFTLPPVYGNLENQVSGHVYDGNTNEPLVGCNVMVKGTTIGTVTDVNGNFTMSLPNNANLLQFSFVGYDSQDLTAYPSMKVALNQTVTELQEIVTVRNEAPLYSDMSEASFPAAKRSNSFKIKGVSSILPPVEQTINQTSFEFEIKTPYTINSDNKNYSIDVDSYLLNAEYEYYCVPKIDKDAFLVARIVDWEKYNLLEGEANIFFENTYIGKSLLDVRYISDTLSISLGRDKNVVVTRDKRKDFTKKQFLGTKKEEMRSWQVSVKNNKNQNINMALYDQVPVSTMEEIEVSIENLSNGSLNKEKGEVQWKFILEPGKKKDFELTYKVKYPKDRTLNIE